jgi:FKBP-type peptidyl-prolyl cis-trans isomerase FkpA
MRLPLTIAFVCVATLAACAKGDKDFTPKTDEEKELYTLGVLISRNVESFDFTDKEIEIVKAGVDHGARGRAKLEQDEMEKLVPKLQEMQTKRIEAAGIRAKDEGVAYLAKAEKETGAVKLPSGVIVKVTKEGTGAQPVATDTVKVHYTGKLTSGKDFDSSREKRPDGSGGEPVEFPLAGVIPCWGEGVQQLKVGSQAQLVCPSEQAYGAEGRPPQIPGNSVLVFDVELLEIVKAEPAPAAGGAAPAGAAPKAN